MKTNKKKSSRAKPLKITRRIVNTKRHTTGYVIGGKTQSVAQARQLAESGRINGVRVVGNHIQSVPGKKRLTDLPETIK